MQFFSLSIQVYLTLKLIVQATLALIYGIVFKSVVQTYLILQSPPVANNKINTSLFTDKSTRKITSVANFIPNKCLKLLSRCLKSSWEHWVNCTYRELKSVLGLLQKNYCCANGGHKQHLFQQHDFSFNNYKRVANTYSKEQGLLKVQDRG